MSQNDRETVPSLYEVLSNTAEAASAAGAGADEWEGAEASPYTQAKFEQFLLKSHCEENYELWKTCNGYLQQCDDANFDVHRWNTRIYKTFIKENSPMECNLPTDIKRGFHEAYRCYGRLPRSVLYRARQHAWSLMADAYRQYVRQVNSSTPASGCGSPRGGPKIRPDRSPSTLLIPAIELPTLVTGQYNGRLPSNCRTRSSSFSSSGPSTPNSTENSPSESPDAIGAGTQRLLSKGKEFMSRFRTKRRTSFASPSSTNSLYTRFERRASDRTLYQK